jgi:hypothetical protein
MLTKDLLKFNRRSGQVKPKFLDPSDGKALQIAESFLSQFRLCPGLSTGELEESISGMQHLSAYAAGLRKLLLDRLEMSEETDDALEFRWKCFAASEKIRNREHPVGFGIPDFFDEMAEEVGASRESIQEKLYCDLPAERAIKHFKDLTGTQLLHRYNCAQIQGLLLRSKTVVLTFKNLAVSDQRQLFRHLKFHRLMAEIESPKKGVLTITLSGPLSIFQNVQTYGMRLANFFPHVLNLSSWKLSAEVKIKDFDLELKLKDDCGILSHYVAKHPHIPKELTLCLEGLRQKFPNLSIEPGGVPVILNEGNIVVPDINIKRQGATSGKEIPVELFHRWHGSVLSRRMAALDQSKSAMVVGVCASLKKNTEVASMLASSPYFKKHGFYFNDFPTPKKLIPFCENLSKG